MSIEKNNTSRRTNARPRAAGRARASRAVPGRRSHTVRARGTAGAAVPSETSATAKTAPPRHVPANLSGFVARFRVPLVAAVAVLVIVMALYGPACAYYQAWRTNGALQSRDAQATSETDELESDINTLMTEEGIKDEARRRGYVDDGETRIVLEGDEAQDDQGASQDAEQTPWYLALGDFIFQYQEA